ncbi:response regulator [Thauera sp.]|uniref:response regulator n=1 Tax=Thauera sp. TaxID=1905334 RepID=UPI001B67EC44|nr:response regulator [Thauera sp.]MBP6132097.1 response regulator [Thauera sp.]MBP7046393.1 response regulator [Thauera sp.]
MRLLLVEDHAELAEWVARSLRHAGFVLDVLNRGDHADQSLRTERYDLVILDLSLPGLDGLEVLRRLRNRESGPDKPAPTPVLVLTARGSTEERVHGLNLGADDYLPKPFELAELEARIKALLRRAGNQVPLVRLGRLEFDTTTRMAAVDGQALALTPRELAVLEALLARVGRPVAREALFEKMFEFDADARVEAIEIYVSRLRKKLEGAGVAINTLRGLGYLLAEKPAA